MSTVELTGGMTCGCNMRWGALGVFHVLPASMSHDEALLRMSPLKWWEELERAHLTRVLSHVHQCCARILSYNEVRTCDPDVTVGVLSGSWLCSHVAWLWVSCCFVLRCNFLW